ncbi:hypothetical protein E4U19_007057 [Claviceps sp. Clav32 group G5]|nr:hypothetical protein E4U19_007057 [Claviceps sp. Clav32 group G5]
MQLRYQNATAVVQHIGRTGLFITFTGNLILLETRAYLELGQQLRTIGRIRSPRYHAYNIIELCGFIKAIKLLFKYIYKGNDQTAIQVQDRQNEVTG